VDTPVSFTNKTGRHDITEILLNTIPNPDKGYSREASHALNNRYLRLYYVFDSSPLRDVLDSTFCDNRLPAT